MKIKEKKREIESGRVTNGAVSSGTETEWTVSVRRSEAVTGAVLRIARDGEPEEVFSLNWGGLDCGEEKWSVILPGLPVGLYYYSYEIYTTDGIHRFGGENDELLEEDRTRQLLVHRKDYSVPERLSGAVIYHVFVDRFCKGKKKSPLKKGAVINGDWYNGVPQYAEYPGADVKNNEFFGGDIWGIIEKLGYIKSLGTDFIYLSPVFDAASNHKYDTGDYMSVDEMFGGDEALEALVKEAAKYGIGIILDGVFNHTGDDSLYFNRCGHYPTLGAYNSKESEYFNWYSFQKWPDEYECWWGVKILPRVDSSNKSYQSFIFRDVVGKWAKIGISGWRLDVADELDEGFLSGFRKAVKEKSSDAFIIGEVWEDASNKISYGKRRKYLQGDQLDSVMNYPFRDAVITYIKYGDYEKFIETVCGIIRRYPKCVTDSLMNFLGTHDTERIITVLGGESSDGHTMEELSLMKMNKEQYKRATGMVVCAYYLLGILPGALSIYYGDEIGMEGYRDPFCRRPYPWGKENKKILNSIRNITSVRKSEKAFAHGDFSVLEMNRDYAVISRTLPETEETVVCAVNRSGKKVRLKSKNGFSILGGDERKTVRETVIGSMDGVYIKFGIAADKITLKAEIMP